MNQPPPTETQTGKRIVSKGEYIRNSFHQLAVLATGFVGIIVGGVLCGGIPVCILSIYRELSFKGILPLSALLILLSVTFGWCLIKKSEKQFYLAQDMNNVVPLTRANTADLPAPDTLVRASAEPRQEPQAVLLRAATEAQERHEEQLVRASAGAPQVLKGDTSCDLTH